MRNLIGSVEKTHSKLYMSDRKLHELIAAAITENWTVMRKHNQRMAGILEQIIASGMAAGEFHPGDAALAARLVNTACIRFCHPRLMGKNEQEPEPVLDQMVDFCLAALVPQRTTLDHEIAAEREVITETRAATRAALAEADRQLEQAVAQASLAEDQASRHERLFAKGLVAEGEIVRARVEARDRRAAVEGRRLAIQRLEAEQQAKERTSLARLAHLQQQRALLDGQLSSTTATVARLKRESERRRIRAPVDGQLAEVATLRIGSVVREGDRLASVLPRDRLRGVAAFLPEALGRVKAEQRGRFRLDSFPSTQYGSIPVRVVGVGGEPRDGVVRVEFEIEPDPTFPAPLRHGLPGILEVAVEYVTPAALVLRTAGALITLPPAARRVGTPQR